MFIDNIAPAAHHTALGMAAEAGLTGISTLLPHSEQAASYEDHAVAPARGIACGLVIGAMLWGTGAEVIWRLVS